MIKKVAGGYKVVSESGKKNLGGPYKTKKEAEKRLRQVEFFKHRKGRAPSRVDPPPIGSPTCVLKLLRLPTHCYNNNAKAATERTHPATAPAHKPTTAQHQMRSTHGRIQRRRLHRL